MAGRRSILNRARRKKINGVLEIQLTSMIDVLVIILVFLLKSTVSQISDFELQNGVQMPISRSSDAPPNSFHLVITPEAIIFDSQRVVEFEPSAETNLSSDGARYQFKKQDVDGLKITPLFDALKIAKDRVELLKQKAKMESQKAPPPFDGILAIQADKRITYDMLRKIMYTSAASGFRLFNFLATNPSAGEATPLKR
jgi:biopolymer transport protein ExbD